MANPVVHFEINSLDLEKAQRFYGGLFDWKLEPQQFPYAFAKTRTDDGVGIDGGLAGPGPEDAVTGVTVYVQTDDIDATLAKAVELGGTVFMPVTTIPGTVTFALFKDPDGNIVGLAASRTRDA